MSKADDQSLLAMQAARMSEASIAQTMGWRVARVQRRLQELAAAAQADVASPEGSGRCAEGSSGRFIAPSEPVAVPDRPIGPGEALILRSFETWGGGRAAHGQLADERRVLIWIGDARPAALSRIAVEVMPADAPGAGEFHWRAAASDAGAGANV